MGIVTTQHISYLSRGIFILRRLQDKSEICTFITLYASFRFLSRMPNFEPYTASIVSIVQYIVYFNQKEIDQALLGWGKKKKKKKHVLLAEKMTIFNYFCQRCSARKKEKK